MRQFNTDSCFWYPVGAFAAAGRAQFRWQSLRKLGEEIRENLQIEVIMNRATKSQLVVEYQAVSGQKRLFNMFLLEPRKGIWQLRLTGEFANSKVCEWFFNRTSFDQKVLAKLIAHSAFGSRLKSEPALKAPPSLFKSSMEELLFDYMNEYRNRLSNAAGRSK